MDVERIRQLIDAAAQARERGRVEDAERLLRQAEREAPRHRGCSMKWGGKGWPQVTRRVPTRCSRRRSKLSLPIRCCGSICRRAARARPPRRGDGGAQRVLAIEPRNVRALLQKASLLELQEKRARRRRLSDRAAVLPHGSRTPEWMAQIWHAREAVDANDRALEVFVEERLTTLRERYADQPLRRFEGCLATLLQKERIYRRSLRSCTFRTCRHRVLRAQGIPVARLDRGRDGRYSRGTCERVVGWRRGARALRVLRKGRVTGVEVARSP